MQIFLASQSPRRKELLSMLDVPFSAAESHLDERALEKEMCTLTPAEKAAKTAEAKALAAAKNITENAIVLGADTIVAFEGEILHKPTDAQNAFSILSRLSGKSHMVYTGVSLIQKDGSQEALEIRTSVVGTKVTFRPLTEQEILAYIATGEPFDKAGAYGIQGKGSLLVSRIEGDYFNVVGLPLTEIQKQLRHFGIEITAFWK